MSMVPRWLVVAAGLFAVAELIDGIIYRLPIGIVFGVVVGLCTWWASRSRGWPPPAVLGVLAAVEFLLVVFVYSRGDDPAAWWRLVLYGVLSLGVAVLSGVDLARTLRRDRGRTLRRDRGRAIKCDRYRVHLGTCRWPPVRRSRALGRQLSGTGS